MASLRDELEELLGADGLMALSAARGGRRAYIPNRIPPLHWLALRIGQDAADALAARYGGCRLSIPMLRGSRAERNGAIRRWRREGVAVAKIAEMCGLSERQVWRVLRG